MSSRIIITALSGRALASSALRAGYVPLVADLFADIDTCEMAAQVIKVGGGLDRGFDEDDLLHALRQLTAGHSRLPLVYGSGFEARPDLLTRLANEFDVLGNSPAVASRVKDPEQLQALCRAIDVAHPEICRRPPGNVEEWVRKRIGASGGSHVGRVHQAGPGDYFQRFVRGRPISLSFLADGRGAAIVAATEQWSDPTAESPHRLGGIVRPAAIEERMRARLGQVVADLVSEVPLIGLNSVDFLVSDDEFVLLEINPRPGLALDVLADLDGELFAHHLVACRGNLPKKSLRFCGADAAQIVYARRAIPTVHLEAGWPSWTADRQPCEAPVPAGGPLCTVLARGEPDARSAVRLVKERAKAMLEQTGGNGPDLDAGPSVNVAAQQLVEAMLRQSAALRIVPTRGPHGERLIDCGKSAKGGIEAGLWLARICMGGLGDVSIAPDPSLQNWPFSVIVRSSRPVIACLGSQYAGWKLEHGSFIAMGSGPARAMAKSEILFDELGFSDSGDTATIVLESDGPPPAPVLETITRACRVDPERLNVLFAPTRSQAGSVQVVARSLEVALHKAHAVHFPVQRIVDGLGSAPLVPPHPDFLVVLGRTNDAIIYGGRVWLFVSGPAADAKALAESLPSRGSRDHGRPFAEIFRKFDGDFYAIDPMLFSPAEVTVTAIEHGQTYRAGSIDRDLLNASLG